MVMYRSNMIISIHIQGSLSVNQDFYKIKYTLIQLVMTQMQSIRARLGPFRTTKA